MLAVEYPLVRACVRAQEASEEPRDALCAAAVSVVRDQLRALKAQVPIVQRSVGTRRWSIVVNGAPNGMRRRHTTTNPVNRAYSKLHEIILTCGLPRTVRTSVHLCEAPGGFVQCTRDYLAATNWTWRAVTLPSNAARTGYIPSPDPTLPYDCGGFTFVDVTSHSTLDELKNDADLVTADGAFDTNHATLESDHVTLLRAQCRMIVHAIAPGGTAVVKFFEGFEAETRQTLAWLSSHFESGCIVKPTTSRPTNSERYFLCRHFISEIDGLPTPEHTVASTSWNHAFDTIVCTLATAQITALKTAFCRLNAT